MESAVMTSALMSSQSAVGYQQKKREAKEMKRRRAEESADELALMTSSVTSSYSADGLREQSQDISRCYLEIAIAKRCRLDKLIRQRFALALKDSAGRLCVVINQSQAFDLTSWTTSRKQQCIQSWGHQVARLGEVPMHVGVDASLSRIHRVLITRNVIETLHDRCITLTRLPTQLGSSGGEVYLVTHAMSLFDLQDVCMVIGSPATLDLPMVVDLIGIFESKGPYCMLTMTDWFLQALSVIPRGSWGDVSRRFTMIRWHALRRISLKTYLCISGSSSE
ncbi:hypothetical protein F511_27623 [Dorcoceras hygrometricum]|uniref:Uncharacterized protein n=1 Tax=Dorcoceras hygrometricum TaxID=472368 RepID=A0A2Z7B371_9LAMI|nr:hypothetical protein F511_27623 [Dorcoceras hygrometricum]